MHLVQALTFFLLPLRWIVAFWMLGRNIRFVTLCEWLTLRPAEGDLPQMEHTFDILKLPLFLIFANMMIPYLRTSEQVTV